MNLKRQIKILLGAKSPFSEVAIMGNKSSKKLLQQDVSPANFLDSSLLSIPEVRGHTKRTSLQLELKSNFSTGSTGSQGSDSFSNFIGNPIQAVKQQAESFKIPFLPSIEVKKITGSTVTGLVYLGVWKQTAVCLQVVRMQDLSLIMEELQQYSQLKHPHIVNFFGLHVLGNDPMLVTEYFKNGDLQKFLTKENKITIKQVTQWSRDVAEAMKYAHHQKILHRNLAAHNVFLVSNDETDFEAKVGNFGIAAAWEPLMAKPSAPRWTSPEVICQQKFCTSSDVWSFGVLLWEMFSPTMVPYSQFKDSEIPIQITEKNVRLQTPPQMPPELAILMKACFHPKPLKRPDFSTISKKITSIKLTQPDEILHPYEADLITTETPRSLSSNESSELIEVHSVVPYFDVFNGNIVTRSPVPQPMVPPLSSLSPLHSSDDLLTTTPTTSSPFPEPIEFFVPVNHRVPPSPTKNPIRSSGSNHDNFIRSSGSLNLNAHDNFIRSSGSLNVQENSIRSLNVHEDFVYILSKKCSFFYNISVSRADELLKNQPAQTFLLRSHQTPQNIILSFRTSNCEILHYLLGYENEQQLCWDVSVPHIKKSLPNLLHDFKNKIQYPLYHSKPSESSNQFLPTCMQFNQNAVSNSPQISPRTVQPSPNTKPPSRPPLRRPNSMGHISTPAPPIYSSATNLPLCFGDWRDDAFNLVWTLKREDAEERLKQEDADCFLLRSASIPNALAVSRYTCKTQTFSHFLLKKSSIGFFIENFESPFSISYYRNMQTLFIEHPEFIGCQLLIPH